MKRTHQVGRSAVRCPSDLRISIPNILLKKKKKNRRQGTAASDAGTILVRQVRLFSVAIGLDWFPSAPFGPPVTSSSFSSVQIVAYIAYSQHSDSSVERESVLCVLVVSIIALFPM